jgi:hypothetical protein
MMQPSITQFRTEAYEENDKCFLLDIGISSTRSLWQLARSRTLDNLQVLPRSISTGIAEISN